MNKKIILSFFASLLFLSQVANAEIKVGGGSLTFTAGVMSQYISRGIDQNSDRPSPYASIDFTRSIGVADFYAGIWSAAATGDNYTREENYYAGLKKSLGIATIDLGLNSIKYNSGNRNNNPINSVDGYVKINIAPEKSPFTLGAQYIQSDSGGNVSGTVKNIGETYQEINASYDFKVLTASVSYGEQQNDRDIKTLALSKSFMETDFTVTYSKVERKHSESAVDRNRDYLVLSVNKEF